MNSAQKTVLWIGLILVTLNFLIGGWTTWKDIIFKGPAKANTNPKVLPSPIPGIPFIPIVPLSASAPKSTPAKNQVVNA